MSRVHPLCDDIFNNIIIVIYVKICSITKVHILYQYYYVIQVITTNYNYYCHSRAYSRSILSNCSMICTSHGFRLLNGFLASLSLSLSLLPFENAIRVLCDLDPDLRGIKFELSISSFHYCGTTEVNHNCVTMCFFILYILHPDRSHSLVNIFCLWMCI